MLKNKLFALISIVASILLVGCQTTSSSSEIKTVDYVSQTKIQTTNWKETSFWDSGTGIVTLSQTIDGDTAHFRESGKSELIKARFNGVDTPESTGKVEPWGKAASRFTESKLSTAKTIVLETEHKDGSKGPISDSTGDRYLTWIWVSEKTPELEDGSTLKLVNLWLIQEGFSKTKAASGSVYSEALFAADAQAMAKKIYVWSDDKDPDYYYGSAIPVSIKDIQANSSEYLGKRVQFEGVVTRMLNVNFYIQESYKIFDDKEEEIGEEDYGIYVFTSYQNYSIVKLGNRLRVIGVVGEFGGSIQITDVSYSQSAAYRDPDRDMVLVSTDNDYSPKELTVTEYLKENPGVYVKIANLVGTGGYDSANGAININCKDENNVGMVVRIDASVFIRDPDDESKFITTFTYFVGKTFTVAGIIGSFEGQKQLMLLATPDLFLK